MPRGCPPPGRLVDAGDVTLHVRSLGTGVPTVVFISGIAASCLNWWALQQEIASHTRTVSYDRPGLGWSPLGPRGLTAAAHARQLREALSALGAPPPYVLVTHSFGAYVALLFTELEPDTVRGLVLIDPITWQEWMAPDRAQRYMLRGGAFVARAGALLAALGVVRFAVRRFRRGSEGVGRAILGSFGTQAVRAVSRVMGEVGKMPPETWDAIQAHWSHPRAFVAMARHFVALPRSATEVRRAAERRTTAWTMPVVVLGAGDAAGERVAAQQDLARQSTGGRHVRVAGAGHWIHLDRPGVVRSAILEVMTAA
jgi:pimeloyl-ACP methyl ester carboxylesterase